MIRIAVVGKGVAYQLMCRFVNDPGFSKHGESHWVGKIRRGSNEKEVEIFWFECLAGVGGIAPDWIIQDWKWESEKRRMAIGNPKKNGDPRIMRINSSDHFIYERHDGASYNPVPDIAGCQLAAIICPFSHKRRAPSTGRRRRYNNHVLAPG